MMAESLELLLKKLSVWKENKEAKGVSMNIGRTKVMKCKERNATTYN